MINLAAFENLCGNPVTPYRLTQSVSRWGLSEGQGCALQPDIIHAYRQTKGTRVAVAPDA